MQEDCAGLFVRRDDMSQARDAALARGCADVNVDYRQ